MKSKKTIFAAWLVFLLIVLQSCSPSKPSHYGFFLNDSAGLTEMDKFEGPPSTPNAAGIPQAKENPPTVIAWQQNVNLDRLVLLSKLGDQDLGDQIPYDASPKSDGMYELRPKTPLNDGGYCYVQGDPLGAPYHLDTWCFWVGVAAANASATVTASPQITATNQTITAETKTVTYGSGGRFISIQFASNTAAEAAWTQLKDNPKVVAGWLGVNTLNLYLSTEDASLENQIKTAVGPSALVKLDDVAGPALVSDPATNTILSSGGVMLLFEIDADPAQIKDSDNPKAFEVMSSRLEHISGASFWLQTIGHEKILLLLGAGVNTEDTDTFIKQRAFVEFVDLAGGSVANGNRITTDLSLNKATAGVNTYHTFLTGDEIDDAQPVNSNVGQPAIKIHLNSNGESKMLEFTKNNIGKSMAVVLDGRVLFAPQIGAPIGNDIVIDGNFTPQQRDETELWLKYGSLPEPYKTSLSATLSKVEVVHQ